MVTPKRRKPLIVGHRMVCPRCKRPHDILSYLPLQQIEEFADETVPIYKCPDCSWVFAPIPQLLTRLV